MRLLSATPIAAAVVVAVAMALLLLAAAPQAHASVPIYTIAPTTNANVDTARYSYLCLQSNQDLCLGISPGDGDPVYDPNNVYFVQLKKRLKNEQQGLDYKKTRWDVRIRDKRISLSRFSQLCMAKQTGQTLARENIGLYPCDMSGGLDGNLTGRGIFDFDFSNLNGASVIQLRGTGTCLTTMTCQGARTGFCNPDSTVVATSSWVSGMYIKARPCWWTPFGDPSWQSAQVFRQKLDCAVGCSPFLQNNNVCDLPCANSACNLDNGRCKTASPTPPTLSPTASPSTHPSKAPTRPPTTKPSKAPTTSKPTKSPTVKPSKSPTRHPTTKPTTQTPSAHPSTLPTESPSSAPSQAPSLAPSEAPTTKPTAPPVAVLQAPPATNSPTSAPTAAPVPPVNVALIVGITVPLFLLLLLCCLFLVLCRERRRKRARDPKNWKSPVDVNRAAYEDHQRKAHGGWCACCFGAGVVPPAAGAAAGAGAGAGAASSPQREIRPDGVAARPVSAWASGSGRLAQAASAVAQAASGKRTKLIGQGAASP